MDQDYYEFSDYAKMVFGYPELCPAVTAKNYGYALLCISGADGEVSESELHWLTKYYGFMMGAPKELTDDWTSFDYKKANLSDVLKNLDGVPVNFSRALIFDAIRMASADGYVRKEKRSVYTAAKILGVDKHIVAGLECLVENELTFKKHMAILLEVPSYKIEDC